MENDNAIGREVMPVVICDLVGKLQVRRCIKFREGEPPKTYGNVSPDDMSYETVDEESLSKTKITQEEIWKLAKEKPGAIPLIVAELVNKGIYYELNARIYLLDKVAHEMSKSGPSWPDTLWTSQVIGDTIVGIGGPALPFLEGKEEQFATILKARINLKIDTEKRKEKLRQIGMQIGRFFTKN